MAACSGFTLNVNGISGPTHAQANLAAAFSDLCVFYAAGLKKDQAANGLALGKQEFVAGEGAGAGAGYDLRTLPGRQTGEQRRPAHQDQILWHIGVDW